jgi:hypothetical protein
MDRLYARNVDEFPDANRAKSNRLNRFDAARTKALLVNSDSLEPETPPIDWKDEAINSKLIDTVPQSTIVKPCCLILYQQRAGGCRR